MILALSGDALTYFWIEETEERIKDCDPDFDYFERLAFQHRTFHDLSDHQLDRLEQIYSRVNSEWIKALHDSECLIYICTCKKK